MDQSSVIWLEQNHSGVIFSFLKNTELFMQVCLHKQLVKENSVLAGEIKFLLWSLICFLSISCLMRLCRLPCVKFIYVSTFSHLIKILTSCFILVVGSQQLVSCVYFYFPTWVFVCVVCTCVLFPPRPCPFPQVAFLLVCCSVFNSVFCLSFFYNFLCV